MSEEKISIGALYSATHLLLIWDHPYVSYRELGRIEANMPFLIIDKIEMFRSWFKILYNDKTGWVNIQNADYKVITDNGS